MGNFALLLSATNKKSGSVPYQIEGKNIGLKGAICLNSCYKQIGESTGADVFVGSVGVPSAVWAGGLLFTPLTYELWTGGRKRFLGPGPRWAGGPGGKAGRATANFPTFYYLDSYILHLF